MRLVCIHDATVGLVQVTTIVGRLTATTVHRIDNLLFIVEVIIQVYRGVISGHGKTLENSLSLIIITIVVCRGRGGWRARPTGDGRTDFGRQVGLSGEGVVGRGEAATPCVRQGPILIPTTPIFGTVTTRRPRRVATTDGGCLLLA